MIWETNVHLSTKNSIVLCVCVFVCVCMCRSCPGAVLLLPLLDLHLSRLCQALDSLRSTSAGGSDSAAASSLHVAPTAGLGRVEEAGLTGFSVEDTGLAALRLLYLVLAHSDEVMTQQ